MIFNLAIGHAGIEGQKLLNYSKMNCNGSKRLSVTNKLKIIHMYLLWSEVESLAFHDLDLLYYGQKDGTKSNTDRRTHTDGLID